MEKLNKSSHPDYVVLIGGKEPGHYKDAIWYSLENFDKCILKALGSRQNTAIDLSDWAEKIAGVEVVEIDKIEVNGTPGIKIEVSKSD